MTAVEKRSYTLYCDAPGDHCFQVFHGQQGESRAEVRSRAQRNRGWDHVRSPLGRRHDDDYCPQHKPAT